MGGGPETLYDAQTLAVASPVHALLISRGMNPSLEVFGMARDSAPWNCTKEQKQALKLEGARLKRTHLSRTGWTDETIGACEDLADRILKHTQGCKSNAFRSCSPICELPSSHLPSIEALSPITYLIP